MDICSPAEVRRGKKANMKKKEAADFDVLGEKGDDDTNSGDKTRAMSHITYWSELSRSGDDPLWKRESYIGQGRLSHVRLRF